MPPTKGGMVTDGEPAAFVDGIDCPVPEVHPFRPKFKAVEVKGVGRYEEGVIGLADREGESVTVPTPTLSA
jgi:hypothetical protein